MQGIFVEAKSWSDLYKSECWGYVSAIQKLPKENSAIFVYCNFSVAVSYSITLFAWLCRKANYCRNDLILLIHGYIFYKNINFFFIFNINVMKMTQIWFDLYKSSRTLLKNYAVLCWFMQCYVVYKMVDQNGRSEKVYLQFNYVIHVTISSS